MKITDKMRLDWLSKKKANLRFFEVMQPTGWAVWSDNKYFLSEGIKTARQAIDAAIKSKGVGK